MENMPKCASCPFKAAERLCMTENGRHPENCPSANFTELCATSVQAIKGEGEFARNAARVECESYVRKDGSSQPAMTRIMEIVNFAKKMNYKRLGLIFCMGLRNEAAVTAKILEAHGFEVMSAICKVGAAPKSAMGIKPEEQLNPKVEETMCNPIMQAELANAMKVEFNILLGLCVGHDTMAIKHLQAPVTIFAVKDRVMAHNPLGAIYTSETYYNFIKKGTK